jgi:hypothetical protein
MKKLLTLAALLGTATLSFGQGYVSFANGTSSRVSNGGALQAATPAGNYYYALLVAPSSQNTVSSADGSFSGWTFAAYGTNTGAAGRLTGNNADSGTGVQINGGAYTAPGGTADFVVVGWSANIGSDWTSVSQGFHGYGNNGTWTVSNSSAPGGSSSAWFAVSVVAQDIVLQPLGSQYNPVFSATGIPNMNFQSVSIPEPATFALAGLGAAALVIFRRRKA